MKKQLLLGDEAIALGAINAGLSGVYAYPGTPSTEITEFIQNHPEAKARGIHSRWCTNEKTAMEGWIDRVSSRRPINAFEPERTRQPLLW